MYSYKIKFITLDDSIAFEIKSPELTEVEGFVQDLLSMFVVISEDKNPTFIALQELTIEIKIALLKFIDKYKARLPQLNAVAAFLNKIAENESFFILPNIEMELVEGIKLRDTLRAIKKGISYEDLTDKTDELFGELLTKYHMDIKGDSRINIGERDKFKRICRFCGKSHPETTFGSKAHAISEALGNKKVILYEECDTCNNKFSRTIEPDIISYLGLFRTFYDVKGKGGSKNFEGENFKIKNNGNPTIELVNGSMPEISDENYNIKLKTGQPLVLQNIYKSLCKYFLSIIDTSELSKFRKTIDWINGDYEPENLPKIAEMVSYHSFSAQPKLTHYLRKVDDYSIPYAVGEFYFTCQVFVFIIPFTSMDDRDFRDTKDYNNFWKTFKHLDKSNGWIYKDYSNDKPKEFTLDLNFQIQKKAST